MTERSEKNVLGGILGIVGGITTIVVSMILFFNIYTGIVYYNLYVRVPLHECRAVIGVFYPIFADFAIVGGTLSIIGGIGLFQRKKWGFVITLIGNILSLKSSFWPNIPAMESGYSPPYWFGVFALNLVIYFILTSVSGKIPMKRVILGLLMGMGFILSFINGIASTTRIIMRGNDFYMFSQRLSFIASICWGLATLGVLLLQKTEWAKSEWVRGVSIGAGILGSISGFVLGFGAIFVFGEPFSMFMLSPIINSVLLLIALFPRLWRKIVDVQKE